MDEDRRRSRIGSLDGGRRAFLLYMSYVIIQSIYLIFVLAKLVPPDISPPPSLIIYFTLLGSGHSGALHLSLLGTSSYLFLSYRGIYRGSLFHIMKAVSIYFLFASASLGLDLILFPIADMIGIEMYSATKMSIDTIFSLLSFLYFYKSLSKEYSMNVKDGAAMIVLLLAIDIFLRIYYPNMVAQRVVGS